ncbi:hypothetical protein DID88_002802 [Monilinia fructigena]|uniref:Inner membrane component domain-containing protein n=1 Tax=Monilinia fructigena TaxID=38457 RepID=A0A395IPC9_9HELO|nr:hypothetical protein DID88_002802 [Monilinia fructigena]
MSRTPGESSHDGLAESFQSTDTIRRRPDNTGGYGTMPSAPQTPQPGDHRNSESSTAGERPQPVSLESSRSFQPARSPMLGPSDRGRTGQRPKKPPLSRRTSSNVQAPHRGQEFSVDDDVTEMEEEMNRQQAGLGIGGIASGFGPLRHAPGTTKDDHTAASVEGTLQGEDGIAEVDEGEDSSSDAESFTLKGSARGNQRNSSFGIRIWKPALLQKEPLSPENSRGRYSFISRWSCEQMVDILQHHLTLVFGWWLALAAFAGALVCFICGAAPSAIEYGRVLLGLAGYLFYPFGNSFDSNKTKPTPTKMKEKVVPLPNTNNGKVETLRDGRLFFGPHHTRSIVGRSRRSIDSFGSET